MELATSCNKQQTFTSDDAFERALRLTLSLEGALNSNSADRGNKNGYVTNFGITQLAFNDFLSKQLLPPRAVSTLRPSSNAADGELIKQFYKDIWIRSEACELSPVLAPIHFDAAVNHGISGARNLFQKVKSKCEQLLCDLNGLTAFNLYLEVRRQKYQALADSDTSQKQFLKGWNNRLKIIADSMLEPGFKKLNEVR